MASSIPFCQDQVQPLQLRVVRSSNRRPVIGPCTTLPDRPSNYRGYSIDRMMKAVEAVQQGKMSVRRASEEYGVPRSTLQDKVSGRFKMNAKSGRTHLTDSEERNLAAFLVGCASIGYAKSRKDVLNIAQQILYSRDAHSHQVTKGWWDSFKARHPDLTLRQSEPLSYARAVANNTEVIHKYFDLLEDTLRKNGLTHRPAQVFNCDETGLPLMHKPPKVVASIGQRHPYAITSNDKAQITVLACGSASGYTIPPMVIFDRKSLKPEMTIGEVPGTFYGLSDNGWMDTELFEEWFKNHFLHHVPPVRPLLLLLDGHSSHYQPELLRIAAAEGVILFCLPPHTTHLLQPLDNGVFGSLKQHWREECHRYCSKTPGKVVNRFNFSEIFHSAWVHGMAMQNIIASFRAVGVFPAARDVVLSQLRTPEVVQDTQYQPSITVPFAQSPASTPRRSLSPTCGPSRGTPHVQYSIPSVTLQVELPTCNVQALHCTPSSSFPPDCSTFSSAEVRRYQVRLEEGYDLPDRRYSQWLSTLQAKGCNSIAVESAPASNKHLSIQTAPTTLERILHLPTPPPQRKCTTTYAKGARVLTSEECIKEATDKKERKKQKEEDKKERAAERQRKAEARQKIVEERQKKKQEADKKKAEERQKKAAEKQRKQDLTKMKTNGVEERPKKKQNGMFLSMCDIKRMRCSCVT